MSKKGLCLVINENLDDAAAAINDYTKRKRIYRNSGDSFFSPSTHSIILHATVRGKAAIVYVDDSDFPTMESDRTGNRAVQTEADNIGTREVSLRSSFEFYQQRLLVSASYLRQHECDLVLV
uniref:Uncharacterized protein n=1 Tax=Salix viminalis TaxID=40686 RepID=A0A6N2KH47_SALVM